MTKYDVEAREKIMAAATELIEQHGDTAKITTRDIAAKAGVGVGLINYHFQTKDNLINQCVQAMIDRVIDGFEPQYRSLQDMKPIDKLRFLVKSTAGFLATRPGISRISIVHDLLDGSINDNSAHTLKVYTAVVREVLGDDADEQEVFFALHTFISSLQVAFLRKDVMGAATGLDFHNKAQRDALVDRIIDRVFCLTYSDYCEGNRDEE